MEFIHAMPPSKLFRPWDYTSIHLYFSELVSDSFVLLRFIFNPDLLFLWLLISYHIWESRLILIHKSFLRTVMFSFLFWMKKRMRLCFRWSVPLFLSIVWGKSLSFWWFVPLFLSIRLGQIIIPLVVCTFLSGCFVSATVFVFLSYLFCYFVIWLYLIKICLS